ncbi:MPN338 family protein [Mycoplasmoides fastidiosum]|nr:hypothetical protein [Mycoplasmoides fastidiosum]UUD37371.1 hypothetical protein NPA10_02185 [Mycoplasmoides fastidiosum]
MRISRKFAERNTSIFHFEKNWCVFDYEKVNDFKIIGNKDFNRQYNFDILIDPTSYVFEYAEKIQLSFYLDEKNNMVAGGFSVNWGDTKPQLNQFDQITDQLFINDVSNVFINKNITKISINNIIDLIDEKSDSNVTEKYPVLFKRWLALLRKRYPNQYDQMFASKQTHKWFFSILIVLSAQLMMYEDLRKFFQNTKPLAITQKILKHSFKPLKLKNVNQTFSPKQDWMDVVAIIRKFYTTTFDTDDVRDLEDIESIVDSAWTKTEDESFLSPIPAYEITRQADISFMDEEQNIFLDDPQFKTFFLLTMAPSLFGLNEDGDRHISYEKYNEKIANLQSNMLLEETLADYVENNICEWNYDYAGFINKNLSSLIIKNANPVTITATGVNVFDVNLHVFNNYFWSMIYTQARFWKLWVLEVKFNKSRINNSSKLRDILYQLNNLKFDWNDDFYGMKEIKRLVQKYVEYNNFESSLRILIRRVMRTDSSFGKTKERATTQYAFIMAAIFGILDFFTTVYSILPVSYQHQTELTTDGLIAIVIGSFLSTILFIGFLVIFYKFYLKRKIAQWKKRRRR